MSSTVVVGNIEATSTSQSAKDMASAFEPTEEKPAKPRVLLDKGEPVEAEEEKDETSQAASVLGKKGGEAAAKARKEAKEAKAPDKAAKPAKAAETKAGEAQGDKETAEETDEEEKPLGKPRDDLKARVHQLSEKKREAEERAERAERALKARETAPVVREAPKPAPVAAKAEDPDPEPQESEFENYADYVKAVGRHSARQEFKAQQEHAAREAHVSRERERIKGLIGEFQGAIAKELEADPQFWDNVPEIDHSTPLGDEIIRIGKRAPAVLRHLSENPEEFQRLSALSSREATREVGILIGRLDAATADTSSEPEVSKAKPPARSVAVSPRIGSSDEDDENAPLSVRIRRFGERELRSSR